VDVFGALAREQGAKGRVVDAADVIAAMPDVIIASWCGKKVRVEKIAGRAEWEVIPAVREGRIVEIKSPILLQPGPAVLTDGLDAILAALWGAAPPP
jgi:iron complex transport system substrate-binding protein